MKKSILLVALLSAITYASAEESAAYILKIVAERDSFRVKSETFADSIKILNKRLTTNSSADNVLVKIKDDSIKQLSVQITELQNKLEEADFVAVKYANGCLQKKYSAKGVEAALKVSKNPFSKKYLGYYKELIPLLENYKACNDELLTILTAAQKDEDRLNKFEEKEKADKPNEMFKNKYARMLKQTNFYKNYYSRKNHIGFLNDIVDIALAKLANHNKNKEFADFTELIIMLTTN